MVGPAVPPGINAFMRLARNDTLAAIDLNMVRRVSTTTEAKTVADTDRNSVIPREITADVATLEEIDLDRAINLEKVADAETPVAMVRYLDLRREMTVDVDAVAEIEI